MLASAVRILLISIAAGFALASCDGRNGQDAPKPPTSGMKSVIPYLITPEDRELLNYLARLEDWFKREPGVEGRDADMLGVVDMVGFARFCDFTPEQRGFFESTGYARFTPESLAKIRNEFERDCGVRLNRRGPHNWIFARRPSVVKGGGYGRLGTVSGKGIQLTLLAADPTTADDSLLAMASG